MAPTEASNHLLFVCTGNICRSPMAQGLAQRYGEQRGIPVECRSASAAGLHDRPAHPNSVRVMQEIGLDISGHVAQPVRSELIDWADHVLVMEVAHARVLRDRYPEAADRIHLLGTFAGRVEIADPLGGWRGRFRRCRDELQECVEQFMDRMPPKEPGAPTRPNPA